MKRRNFLGFLAASAAVEGCSNSVVSRTLSTALDTSFGASSAFDPDYPDRLPYASMAVTIKNNRRALVVLAKAEQGELHWMSADRGVLVTRNGRLVRTVGLPENLVRTDFLEPDFFEELKGAGGVPLMKKRLIDIMPGNRFGMVVEATLMRGPRENTVIHNRSHDTVRFTEKCVVPQLSWEFANTYWVDDEGVVWRSIQHITPGVPPIEMEITKPARI